MRNHEKAYITNLECHELRGSTVLLALQSRPI